MPHSGLAECNNHTVTHDADQKDSDEYLDYHQKETSPQRAVNRRKE